MSEQPIFHPVLNRKYAEEIALKWNTKVANCKGYVTKFSIDDNFFSTFEIHTVGRSYHQELWVPAEELENFNSHIIGIIEVINIFEDYKENE